MEGSCPPSQEGRSRGDLSPPAQKAGARWDLGPLAQKVGAEGLALPHPCLGKYLHLGGWVRQWGQLGLVGRQHSRAASALRPVGQGAG